MKKVLLLAVMILGLNSYSQNMQVEIGTTTDKKYSLSMAFQQNKMIYGIGITNEASYLQFGYVIEDRLQVITKIGLNEGEIGENKKNYNSLKVNLLLTKNLVIGVEVDNRSRGLYNIGYRFNVN